MKSCVAYLFVPSIFSLFLPLSQFEVELLDFTAPKDEL